MQYGKILYVARYIVIARYFNNFVHFAIQKLLGDTDSDLKPEAIASLAQDRSKWRQFVVACSAAE